MKGVGIRASHNLIHDAPHQAIRFWGNDHIIELNEIHNVCLDANDAGAIYAGRDWTMRGTVIRHNYLHDLQGFEGRDSMGVYLDDQFSGVKVRGNVFQRVRRGVHHGGGRDCTIEGNLFIDCAVGVSLIALATRENLDDRERYMATMMKGLAAVPYTTPPWSDRYPNLVNILNDEPNMPKNNLIARNVSFGTRLFVYINENDLPAFEPSLEIRDNLIDRDPGFVDGKAGNFQLRDDSPAWKLGFERIPMERIGLVKDELVSE